MDANTRNQVRPGHGYSLAENDPDQIKREIDRTRAHLDETVSTLSHRLAPTQLMHAFVDMFTGTREGERTGEGGGQMLRSIRDNPVPAALIGAGVAWFLFDRTRGSGSHGRSQEPQVGRHGERDWLAPGATYEPEQPETHREGYAGRLREKGGEIRERASKFGERAGEAGRTARGWAQQAGESISHTAQSVGEAARSVGHAARDTGKRISDRASSAGERLSGGGEGLHLRQRAGDTARSVRNLIEDHPLVVGAAALAVGLIAGLSAPPTRTERKVMGPMRDDLMDEAQRTAREDIIPQVREAGKQVAREAGAAAAGKASEEAYDENASAGDRISKVASAGIHRAASVLRENVQGEEKPQRGTGETEGSQGSRPDRKPGGFQADSI